MSASAGRAVPLFKGDYNSATTYTFYDWVYYQGGTYACKVQSSTGHAPSDTNYWQILCGGAVSDPAELGFGYGVCQTAASTAAKEVTITGFILKANGIVSITFNNAVGASATLSINSGTAKAIYNHGSAIGAGVIKAGDLVTFIYDGTQFQIISIDRSAGGHTIQNPSNSNMNQREKLKFTDAGVTDDSTNDKTVIEVVRDVTASEFENITEDGLYHTPDTDLLPITTEMVADGNQGLDDTLDDIETDLSDCISDISDIDDELSAINNVYGSKNLFKITTITDSATTKGVTFTRNSNNTISLSGTSTDLILYALTRDFVFPSGDTYRLTGGYNSNIRLYVQNSTLGQTFFDNGDGIEFTPDPTVGYTVAMYIVSGTNCANVTLKPMITVASVTDPTYVPYAMTNRELTLSLEKAYLLTGYHSCQVRGDGVKTYSQLCDEVFTKFQNEVSAFEAIIINSVYVGAHYNPSIPNYIRTQISDNDAIGANITSIMGNTWVSGTCSVKKSGSDCLRLYMNGQIDNFSSEVAPDNSIVAIDYSSYKFI